MDREERLRSAKEKLKKFQKKKQNDNPATPSSNDHSLRSTPKGELETVRATPESQMLFTFESKNDTTDPFVPTTTEDQQSMASEVSDQIDQILTASAVRRISDVTSDDLELCRMRNSELEKEKVEIGLINQQLKTQLQQLETDLNASVKFLLCFVVKCIFKKLQKSYVNYKYVMPQVSTLSRVRLGVCVTTFMFFL